MVPNFQLGLKLRWVFPYIYIELFKNGSHDLFIFLVPMYAQYQDLSTYSWNVYWKTEKKPNILTLARNFIHIFGTDSIFLSVWGPFHLIQICKMSKYDSITYNVLSHIYLSCTSLVIINVCYTKWRSIENRKITVLARTRLSSCTNIKKQIKVWFYWVNI